MSSSPDSDAASPAVKGRFDELYDQEVSSGYGREMQRLSYRSPDYLNAAEPYYRAFRDRHPLPPQRPVKIIDLCCGYGVNSLIARFGLKDSAVFEWLARPEPAALKRSAHRWIETDNEIIGLDIARNALDFGRAHTLLDRAICRNLETDDLDPDEGQMIQDVDLLLSTGSLSYISERTIERLLAVIEPERPVISFFWPILGTDTAKVEDTLSAHGFSVSHNFRPLWQRQFKDEAERSRFHARFRSFGVEFSGTMAESGVCASLLIAERPARP